MRAFPLPQRAGEHSQQGLSQGVSEELPWTQRVKAAPRWGLASADPAWQSSWLCLGPAGLSHQAANQLCKLCQAPRRAWHRHGCADQRGKAGLGQLTGVHQAPQVTALSLPSGFPSGRLLRAPVFAASFAVGWEHRALRLGKASTQPVLPAQPLPSPAAQHRHSTGHFTVLLTSQQDPHEGPKFSGNPACLCKPARTILQQLCSLSLSCWHRTCDSDHLSAHYLVLSTHFSQQHSFCTGQHQNRPPSAQWHVEGLQNCDMSSWKNSQELWSPGQEVWGKLAMFVPKYLPS